MKRWRKIVQGNLKMTHVLQAGALPAQTPSGAKETVRDDLPKQIVLSPGIKGQLHFHHPPLRHELRRVRRFHKISGKKAKLSLHPLRTLSSLLLNNLRTMSISTIRPLSQVSAKTCSASTRECQLLRRSEHQMTPGCLDASRVNERRMITHANRRYEP